MGVTLTRRMIGVFGATGTGKTQTALVLAGDWRRRIHYDPAEDCSEGGEVEEVCFDRGEIRHYLKGLRPGENFSVAYQPILPSEEDADYEAKSEALELGYLARIATAVGDCCLIVDEAAEACGQHCRASVRNLVRKGRHRRASMIIASQRPADVRPLIRGECYADEVYLFRLGRKEDLDDVARFTRDRKIADQVAELEDLHGLRVGGKGRTTVAPFQVVFDPHSGRPALLF